MSNERRLWAAGSGGETRVGTGPAAPVLQEDSMSISLLFPGQGAQYPGMGKDLYEQFSLAKEVYTMAGDITGTDVCGMSFTGTAEQLAQTENAQLCIFTHSMAIATVLRAGGAEVEAAAGFSLGECSALCAAGAFSLEQGFQLVALRGQLMGQAATDNGGTMAAVMGLAPDQIEACCAESDGYVEAVNYNSPAQTVIAGDPAAVQAAGERCLAAGASRVVPLAVSGAFHTRYMQPAGEALTAQLAGMAFSPLQLPVYTNLTGRPLESGCDLAAHLGRQMCSPVRWVDTVRNMVADGHLKAAECGPGKVLTGNGRRISREMKVHNLQTADDVKKILDSF